MAHERWNRMASEMASWLQARPELSCHKDELKQLSSSKVVYLIQVHLGMGCHEDELKQLSSSEIVCLIQVDLGMGYDEDEQKQLSSFEGIYLIEEFAEKDKNPTQTLENGCRKNVGTLLRMLTPCSSCFTSFSSCLTSAPRVQLVLKFCTSCSTFAAPGSPRQLVFELCSSSSCSSFALRAGPLQLVADLGSKCLSSATRAQVLHFVLDLGSKSRAQVLDFVLDLGSKCLSFVAGGFCSVHVTELGDYFAAAGLPCFCQAAAPLSFVVAEVGGCQVEVSSSGSSRTFPACAGCSQLVLEQDARISCSSIPQLGLQHSTTRAPGVCSSCSSKMLAAHYCRTPRGLLGATCRCFLPSTDGEQEVVADVHGVFTGKFFAPPNGSWFNRHPEGWCPVPPELPSLTLPSAFSVIGTINFCSLAADWRDLIFYYSDFDDEVGELKGLGDYFVAAELEECFSSVQANKPIL
ncbi:hypothetical protein SLEP1_g42196 [Rubroshorea leprosula]|uniref:Uncharacterized protein n=1 Tax=Rubroshorea leprosula TaxID=152421 RepID=A0AAV5LAE2_9ROSI|nr:hypothetical protein SLEP1_g42196 [Rubroshorea leprosula]